MAALGDRPLRSITTPDIEDLLASLDAAGLSPRTVNKNRAVMSAIFAFALRRPERYGITENPVSRADKRREAAPGALVFFTPEEVEALARSLAAGLHRDPNPAIGADERAWRAMEDAQDAEIVRLAAYAGLRRGELVALRWRDVDFLRRAMTVSRALSADVESSTKSGRVRVVPLPDQAAAALERLSRRSHFTSPDDYVFVYRLGRRLDGSALRRRYERARNAAGLRPLRFHDLRHTHGSLLAADGVDVVTIRAVMGHAQLSTTQRYLHAADHSALAARFTSAFAPRLPPTEVSEEPVGR